MEADIGDGDAEQHRQRGGDVGRAVQVAVRVVRGLALENERRNADAAGDQANGDEQQREADQALQQILRHARTLGKGFGEHVVGEDDAGRDRTDKALQKVGAEARHVADVIADVIGDGRGVAGIILGDVRLGLADEVSAHVGGLGVDAAAHAVEHRHERAAQRVARERHRERNECESQQVRIATGDLFELPEAQTEDEVHKEKTQQRAAADAQTHYRAAAERDFDRVADAAALAGAVRHADVGIRRDLHADEARASGHHRTDEQRRGGVPGGDDRHQNGDARHHDGEDAVLIVDEGIRAHADRRGDLAHALGALRHFLHRGEVERGECQCQSSGKKYDNNKQHIHSPSFICHQIMLMFYSKTQ